MRRLLILCLLLLLVFTGNAMRYNYVDNYVEITVERHSQSSGLEVVMLSIKPLVSILLPDNQGCFSLDTSIYAYGKRHFRNSNCPPYILNQCFNSIYRFIPKDSLITYVWNVPEGRHLQGFYFDVDYIPTTTYNYKAKKRFVVRVPLANGIGLSIRQEDEQAILRKAHIIVTEDK